MIKQVEFQSHTVHELSDCESRVLVSPDFGARLLRWDVGEHQIIQWPEDADWSSVAHVRGGNPILFPFVARHMVDGVVGKWRDDSGQVRDLPMHGFARDLPFSVVDDADAQTLRMRLAENAETLGCYPFAFQFDVVYRLFGNELEVRLETTNTGDSPLPYYAGHHFYFHVPHDERPGWQLTIPCERQGGQNTDGSVWFVPADQTSFTVADELLIDRFHLDFTSTELTLRHNSGRGVVIDLSDAAGKNEVPWYSITTWTQNSDSDFFCVEPWLGLPNAIHHGHGLRWLDPGQKEEAVCYIRAGRK